MRNQSGKRFAVLIMCLVFVCALFTAAGGEGKQPDQHVSVNPEEMKNTAAELQALAAEVASRKEQLREMISQRTGAGAAMSDLYDTKLPAVLKDFEEIESGILNAAEAYEQKANTIEDAADSFSSGEGEQDHSVEINPTELAELAAKLNEYASFLADLQMQLEGRGITLQCNIQEAVERVQGLKDEVTALTVSVNNLDDTMEQDETTIPSFTFDELEFTDQYARTEEFEYTAALGSHVHETRYYDADGFLVYMLQVVESTDGSTITRNFWKAKIGDSGFVATKSFTHGDAAPGHTFSRNDFWSYYVYNENSENHTVTVVDENGKPVQ